MNSIYLRNHDVHDFILAYSPERGQFEEKARAELGDDVSLSRGFYVNVKGVVIGVYASSRGPVLFHNNERFLLADEACRIELATGVDENQFILRWNGQEHLTIRYPRVKIKDFDVWSDEETVDFLLWLQQSVSQAQFFDYYTV